MGLFSNKDKPCPMCGGATPRLLAKKINGQPICGKCNDEILADDERVDGWTLDDLRAHLAARQENQKLLENFTPTRTVEYEYEAVVDDANQLFYIKQWSVDNPPVFRFSEISGFTVEMGYHTVESWSVGMARVPFQPRATGGVLGGLAALAEVFDDDKDSKFENIKVTLKVNTPYLSEYELCDLSVSGSGQAAFANDMAREMAKVNTICNFIVSIAGGTAPAPGAAAAAPTVDRTADDIRKFKELLDAGVITPEEFDAKKKQLLGI